MRVILIILVIYIGWRLFWRYVFPFLLTLIVKKASEKMQNGGGGTFYYTNVPPKKEGEVTIDQSNARKGARPKPSIDGEYVDFEEVK